MKILLIDNSIEHKDYQPEKHWEPHFIHPFDLFRGSHGKLPADIDEYSHIIISGSEASIHKDFDWIPAQEELIRKAVAADKAIFGSCYGHQMIVRALFGKKCLKERKYPEVGWVEVNILRNDPVLGRSGQVVHCYSLHYDEVTNLPEDKTEIIASNRECPVHAFRLKGKNVWGIQAHPEINIEDGLKTTKSLGKKAGENKKYFDYALTQPPKDSGWIIQIMQDFQKA